MTIDMFKQSRACADPMLVKAMNLAITTGQRRGDILKMKFSDVKDGFLQVIQSKVRDKDRPDAEARASKVRIPLGLHVAALNLTLGSAIANCRDNIISKAMIHHIRHQGRAKPGARIRDKTIEQLFRDARSAAGIAGPNAPTFHEIRSLAARLLEAQGVDVKALLGHKSEQMAALYQDVRGAEGQTIHI